MHLQYIVSRRGRVGSSKEHHTHVCMSTCILYYTVHRVHRHRERFNRHCPSPSTGHCRAKICNEISNLTTSSVICTHQLYIQEINPIKTQNVSDSNQTIDAIITTLQLNIQLLQLNGENISKKEVYEMILYGVADKLAASMKSDQGVFLSKLYHDFVITIITEFKNYPSLSSTEQKIPLAIAGFFLVSTQYLMNL